MKKLLLAIILLAFPLHLFAAQITLDTAVDATLDGNAGDETGEDLRLTIFGALGDQNTMNTELYGAYGSITDLSISTYSGTTLFPITTKSGYQSELGIPTTGAAVGTLFSGIGEYLKKDGSSGTPTGGSGGLVSAPTYSDDTCTAGTYAISTSPSMYWCIATDTWDYQVVSGTDLVWAGWSNPTPSYPTLSSAVLGTDGQTFTLTFSEALDVGSGGNGGWTADASTTGSDLALSYSSGDGTDTYVYTTASGPIESGETVTVSYVQPTDGLEDSTGDDLQSITDNTVTNNSTQTSGGATIIDDDFSAGHTNWTGTANATLDSSSGGLKITSSDGNQAWATHNTAATEISTQYDYSVDVVAEQFSCRIYIGGVLAVSGGGPGTKTGTVTATSTEAIRLFTNADTIGNFCTFDNVVVSEH